MGYRGLQGVTIDYKRLQSFTWGYKGSNRLKRLQEVTGGCKLLKGITRG